MERADKIIPARMSLSVRTQPSQLECAFTIAGRELRAAAPLLSDKLLSDHRRQIILATQQVRPSSPVLPTMRHQLQRIIPGPARALLRDVVMQYPEATSIALEIKLNDPLILERYPWELLA